ncbi:MAG: kinase [Bacteroidales bacterium]|jgi:hypothetical protein|nr:kinase [Bacteroidales bacterium]
MYQTVDGKIAITVNDWLEAGLTKNMLWKDSSKNLLTIFQRGIGENSLIDVNSIKRPERLRVIEGAFGTINKVDATTGYRVELDSEALSFFRSYRYDDNKSLPESIIEQYHHEASILNTLEKVYQKQQIARKKYGAGKRIKMNEFWNDCVSFCQKLQEEYRHNLPVSVRHFERKYKKYQTFGYESLIHKGYGNKYTEKLTEEAKDWLIARYASQINKCTVFQLFVEYNERAASKADWKEIKDEKTIRNFLYKPEIKAIWYGSRYGELKSKEKYTRQHKTLLPTMRDSLWYGDGTKLNFYYIDENGSIATCNVYEVMDVYSECLLGYHISKSEDFEAQYKAYKMAMIFSGHKPYEIRFDNQGGHKKLQAGAFFKGLSRLAINTQPYNGRSKTIESAFGRFQSQFLHKEWFFTGMNVTAKKIESKTNMEFILANKHNLKTLNEITKQYEQRREEWNNAPHPATGISRIKMYRQSNNEKSKKIDIYDMISMFGVINPKAITYRSNGIVMEVKRQKYQYEVLTIEGVPDFDFLRKNIDKEFHIGYDIEDMSTVVLFEKAANGDYRHVSIAQKYITIHRNKQEQDELDSAFIAAMDKKNKQLRESMQEDAETILERHEMHPSQHGLNMPQPKGIKRKETSIGKVLKKESELVETEEEFNAYNIY